MVSGNTSTELPQKQQAILAAARTLFAEKSYEATTIADIARKAGIAVGTVYLYFRNKHEVYMAVALDLDCQLADAFQDPTLLDLPLKQAIDQMLDTLFQICREQMQLANLLQVDMRSPEELEQHRITHERITSALITLFERAITRGELAPFNVAMYADMLNVMGNALLHQCFAVESGTREIYFRTAFADLLQRIFFGPSLSAPQMDLS